MIFHRHVPGPPLSQYVDFFWYFEEAKCDYGMEKVLPDCSGELLINLQEIPRKLFDKAGPERWRDFHGAWFSGPQKEFLTIDALPVASMMGAHFRPGGVFPFLGMPATEMTGRVEHLDSLWGREGWKFRERLLETPSPQEKFRLLELFLLSRSHNGFEREPAVAYALKRFMAAPHELTVSEVAQTTGISHKRFIAMFKAETGLTPKRFCRLQRFQCVLKAIETRKAIEWADLASACGYYDQAHFIHEFRAFSGLNPSAYLTQKGEYLNFVPVRG